MKQTKLLLVDDEKAFIDTISKRLVKRDFEVLSANSAQEGLDILAANNTVDVVILDVKMPGMDGLEALGKIRAQFPLVEVIMLTGHATVESAITGMEKGAFGYLMKPCELDILVEKCKGAVAKKREQEERIMEARMQEITGSRV